MGFMKVCNRCHKNLLLIDFPIDLKNKDGHKGICKNCTAEYNKKYHARQKGKIAKIQSLEIDTAKQEYILGGIKAFVLNHVKEGEFKYNVINTDGRILKTNQRGKFFSYLEEEV